MVEILNGPVPHGTKLHLRRTPVFLRIVINQRNRVDALDMPEDRPTKTERMYAYRMVDGTQFSAYICGKKHGCVLVKSAMYKFVENQPEENILRDRELWEQWVEKTYSEEK